MIKEYRYTGSVLSICLLLVPNLKQRSLYCPEIKMLSVTLCRIPAAPNPTYLYITTKYEKVEKCSQYTDIHLKYSKIPHMLCDSVQSLFSGDKCLDGGCANNSESPADLDSAPPNPFPSVNITTLQQAV